MDGITDSLDLSLSIFREIVKDREAWSAQCLGSQRVRHDLATEQQQGHASVCGAALVPGTSEPELSFQRQGAPSTKGFLSFVLGPVTG